MFTLIARLRARPVAYRRAVALWTAVCIMALVIIVWALSLPVRFEDADDAVDAPSAPGPLETFVGQVKNLF